MESLERFEKLVRTINAQIFTYGIDELKKQRIIKENAELGKALRDSPAVMRRFIRGCHYGFDLAQRRIGEIVIGYEKEVRDLVPELKEARRKRDAEAVSNITNDIETLKHRQLIVRRLEDCILQHLVSKEPWMLRRMQTSDDIHRIDPATLASALSVATRLNRADRTAFHVVSDLTTAVHTGDLIKLAFEGTRRWELIELKEGKVNSILNEIISNAPSAEQSEIIADVEAKMGTKATSQIGRMLRQKHRERQIESFRTADRGIDPKEEVNIFLRPDVVIIDDYWSAVRNACSGAKSVGVSVSRIDNCLNLVAVSREVQERIGRHGIAHSFLHITEPKCDLGDPEKVAAEFRRIEEMSPIVNLKDANLESMGPKPIFMWSIDPEFILDLIFERLYLYAQLDLPAFFSKASQKGIRLEWCSKQSGLVRSPKIPGSPNACGIRATVPAHPEWPEQIVFAAFLGRVFLELMRPDQLLDMLLHTFENPLKHRTRDN